MSVLKKKTSSKNSDIDLFKKYQINTEALPNHIAIIMDGNGRWAKSLNKPRFLGHKEGLNALRRTIEACKKFGVKCLSVYAFSSQNWSRPDKEINYLLFLLKKMIATDVKKLHKENIKVKFLGDIEVFDISIQDLIRDSEKETESNTSMQLNIMLNYGGREEIISATKKIAKKMNTGDILELTEAIFEEHLLTKQCPEIDLCIRTSGELRLSNFMLWQLSYSELFFIPEFWPQFNEDILGRIISDFQKRTRRFGGL
jgi:undecaprenyl diphosphate synthase